GQGAVDLGDMGSDRLLGFGGAVDFGADFAVLFLDQALLDIGAGADQGFQLLGADVLAAGQNNQVLLAAGDVVIALLVLPDQVAGVEPAINQDLGGQLGLLVVAQHDR